MVATTENSGPEGCRDVEVSGELATVRGPTADIDLGYVSSLDKKIQFFSTIKYSARF